MSVYSMPHSNGKSAFDISIHDGVGESSIDRTLKLLAGFGHDAQRAIGSAIKRAAQSGEAHAARAVGNQYYVKAGDFKKYTKSKRHFTTQNGSTTVDIEFRGFHIPLMKFNTKVGKDGRVSTQVMRSSAKATLDHVFTAAMGSHLGLYERITDKRFPVEEKYGPSTVQMMASNEDVEQEIGDKVREVFDKRIEHEILAVMNGWRKDGKVR